MSFALLISIAYATSTPAYATNIPVASNPTILAFNPSGTLAYVTNSGSGTVSVIDPSTGTVVNTITVGEVPLDVAFNPSGTLAYVVNFDDGTVSVIDPSTGTVINTITAATSPEGIGAVGITSVAFNPSGTFAYITDYATGNVIIINTTTDTVVKTTTVASGLSSIAFDPSGTFAYVTGNLGTVSVIDPTTLKVLSTITVGDDPEGVAFNPSGTLAYVANYGSGTVSVIDPSTGSVINTITVGSNPDEVAFNPSGTLAYVTNSGSGMVSVIVTSTSTVVNTITVGTEPDGVAFNPSGTVAYVTNKGSGTVSVIDQLPEIILTPSVTTIDADQSVTFTNTTTGGLDPYSFAYSVAPSSNVTVSGNGMTFATPRTYEVNEIVTDSLGMSAASLPVTITVTTLPVTRIKILNRSIIEVGQNASFSADVSGGIAPYSYIWTLDDNVISRTTNTRTTTLIGNLSYLGVDKLAVVATDKLGSKATNSVFIIINPVKNTAEHYSFLSASFQNSTSTLDQGQAENIAVNVIGGMPQFTYAWALDGTELTQNGASMTFNANTTDIGSHELSVNVTDSVGEVASASQTVTVLPPTTTTTSIAITSSGGGSFTGGGAPPSQGGGRSYVPSVVQSGLCKIISNFTTPKSLDTDLYNSTFNLTDNFITPTTAGVTINGKSYTLLADKQVNISTNQPFSIELLNISYLPIVHSISLSLCFNEAAQTTTTTTIPPPPATTIPTTTPATPTTIPTTTVQRVTSTVAATPPPASATASGGSSGILQSIIEFFQNLFRGL
jgi:YVTN family beta-propeller protein